MSAIERLTRILNTIKHEGLIVKEESDYNGEHPSVDYPRYGRDYDLGETMPDDDYRFYLQQCWIIKPSLWTEKMPGLMSAELTIESMEDYIIYTRRFAITPDYAILTNQRMVSTIVNDYGESPGIVITDDLLNTYPSKLRDSINMCLERTQEKILSIHLLQEDEVIDVTRAINVTHPFIAVERISHTEHESGNEPESAYEYEYTTYYRHTLTSEGEERLSNA